MREKIRLGISSCLLGNRVRYDGQHKLDHFLVDVLGQYVEWVPVCPEVECGLPVPREAMRLVGDPEHPRLVTIKTRIDHTDRMLKWASRRARELDREDLCGFVFKSRSPSSGMKSVKVYNDDGMPSQTGVGLFAKAFMDRFPLLPVEDEGRLNDALLRENFIERIFAFHRWKTFRNGDGSLKGLIRFHTEHKLLLMAHSPKHYQLLGKLVADTKSLPKNALLDEYSWLFFEGLAMLATNRKHTNVLQHMMGYFRKRLSSDEKAELGDIIKAYHAGIVPLIVPVTLINHYVRKYDEPYLKQQVYLNPHPYELKLRNHA
ncbi:MAG: DUF523 and DUF1722 domain-containing protein [Nitrospiraceae bacterium]|jgi:uncharacterized protein YbgA (DUF1722 family)/uncharacterized protein YbbK (DUF523 family)|nr:DUF523 and DUF1722 domain-containing protein [Nitrospiraceae bacterium]